MSKLNPKSGVTFEDEKM